MLPNNKMVFLLLRLACATMAQIPFGIAAILSARC